MYLSVTPPSHYSSALKCFSQCVRAQETWLQFTGLLLYWIKGMFLSCLTWSTWIFTAPMFELLKLKERKPASCWVSLHDWRKAPELRITKQNVGREAEQASNNWLVCVTTWGVHYDSLQMEHRGNWQSWMG